MQWYRKFRTHNTVLLQQVWASSVGKSSVVEMKNKKWGFKVLWLEKWGSLAA